MPGRHLRLLLVATPIVLAVAACGGDAPPPGVPPEELVGGREVRVFYARNCSSCHGPERQGRIGPPLTPEALTEEPAYYEETIAFGRRGTAMPAWGAQALGGGLPPREVARLVAWLMETPPR